MQPVAASLVDEADGFRFTNLIDLVFPRWKDAVAHVTPKDYESMGKAMRYYRVWIYISCIATVVPAIIFAGVVGWIFSADYFRLLPIPAYDWTFLYLYAAVFFQIFIAPALGCAGACRLSKPLLWTYWWSLVTLCFFDAWMGVAWALKFNYLNKDLLDYLRTQIDTLAPDAEFTRLWDGLQRQEGCCGVTNASDYFNTTWFRQANGIQPIGVTEDSLKAMSLMPFSPSDFILPQSCCSVANLLDGNCTVLNHAYHNVYRGSCYLALHTWMHAMGDILFVIGYAIMGFIRGSLVFCLYSEIKHFIRKIYIRGVPRELHHASVSVGSDLINYHRHNSASSSNLAKKRVAALHPSNSAVPLASSRNNGSGRGDGSLRRWSFMRHWKGWSGIANRNSHDDDDLVPTTTVTTTGGGGGLQHTTVRPSTSSVKLKSINEENTTML